MEAHRIGVISDTHGLLRPEVTEILKSCELILHAGDVGQAEILRQLEEAAPVYAVRGNADQNQTGHLPPELELELFGFRIFMIHNREQIRSIPEGTDVVISGHSHKYEESSRDHIFYLNPGSCGPKRFWVKPAMMVLTLYPEQHRMETEKIDLASAGRAECASAGQGSKAEGTDRVFAGPEADRGENALPYQDMHELVKKIMKQADAGKTVCQIAERNHVDRDFAEQVCRMYLTHPGVDVEGILDRIVRRQSDRGK